MGAMTLGESPASLWSIENPVDLSQWQWRPPTSPAERQATLERQANQTPTQGIGQALSEWLFGTVPQPTGILSGSIAPEPRIAYSSQAELLQQSTFASATEAENSSLEAEQWQPTKSLSDAIPENFKADKVRSKQKSPRGVVAQGLEALYHDITDHAKQSPSEAITAFRSLCDKFEEDVYDGRTTAQDMCLVSQIWLDKCRSMKALQPENASLIEQAIVILIRCTSRVMNSESSEVRETWDSVIWSHLLSHVAQIRRAAPRALLFDKIMASVPKGHRQSMSNAITQQLEAFLQAISERGEEAASDVRWTKKFAQTLDNLDWSQLEPILRSITQELPFHQSAKSSDDFQHLRTAWLDLLARLSSVDTNILASVASSLDTAKDHSNISQTDICKLFVTHQKTHGQLAVTGKVRAILAEPGPSPCAALSMILWRTEQPQPVKDLHRFLEQMGRSQDAVAMLKGLRNLVRYDVSPLTNLAFGIRNYELGLDIMYQWANSKSAGFKNFWESPSATEACRLIINHPKIMFVGLFRALGLVHDKKKSQNGRRTSTLMRSESKPPASQDIPLKACRLAEAIVQSPNVGSSIGFLMIRKCLQNVRHNRFEVPDIVLEALIKNITKDLEEGRPGRNVRLAYLLHIVEANRGREEMIKLGNALAAKRDQNFWAMKRATTQGRHWQDWN